MTFLVQQLDVTCLWPAPQVVYFAASKLSPRSSALTTYFLSTWVGQETTSVGQYLDNLPHNSASATVDIYETSTEGP